MKSMITFEKSVKKGGGDNAPSIHILPVDKKRKVEGGLRTKGYLKQNHQDEPLLTVITVVFNGQDVLEETILSILNQSYGNMEYVIVDGGSTDGTLEIIRKYADAIDYWVSEKDNGIYDAMNKGIDLATGDWNNFMNAGDSFFDTHVVQRAFERLISQNDPIYFLYGGADIYTENGDFLTSLAPLDFTKLNLNMLATRTVCHQSIFICREIVPKYSSRFALKGELDWYYEIIKKIGGKYSLKLDFSICKYSLGGTGDVHFLENLVERIKVMKKHNCPLLFVFLVPFLIIPLVFRLKRKISAK